MPEIKYAIGGLDFEPDTLRYLNQVDFVIGLEGETASFYTKELAGSHVGVAQGFGLGHLDDKFKFTVAEGKRVIGGGQMHLDTSDNLVLDGFSSNFGTIPDYAGYKFGELLRPEMERIGINVHGIRVRFNERMLNKYWIETATE